MGGVVGEQFIGAGWAFPMGVNHTGGIALVRRNTELQQAMRLILTTYPGERPMRPEFGSRIRDYIFGGITHETINGLTNEVRQALLRWDPRVDIIQVNVYPDPGAPSTLYIDIEYAVKSTNDKRNLVFPFYTIPEDGSDY
jgi:phage baseplate assembly protein W